QAKAGIIQLLKEDALEDGQGVLRGYGTPDNGERLEQIGTGGRKLHGSGNSWISGCEAAPVTGPPRSVKAGRGIRFTGSATQSYGGSLRSSRQTVAPFPSDSPRSGRSGSRSSGRARRSGGRWSSTSAA